MRDGGRTAWPQALFLHTTFFRPSMGCAFIETIKFCRGFTGGETFFFTRDELGKGEAGCSETLDLPVAQLTEDQK